jgi:phosphoribosylamine--glycine ligase / phosphoribosylformylglycinamidine cyclo-ligase
MNVLLLGSGGREHAMADALLRSRLGELQLFVAPGNAGTTQFNVALDLDDHEDIVSFCESESIDLVVVGPEAPLVEGLADDLMACGIACFGPSAAAAQLEGSKAFTREFASRHGIPSPRSAKFTDVEQAVAWLDEIGKPVVVKADGLAGGKGVVIPADRVETERAIFEMLSGQSMGAAGTTIVLEECLAGEELSLIGFCDGKTVRALPPAQDHKRVGEGDTGLNTGGMGAFAPVPGVTATQVIEYTASFLQRAVDGMATEGTPYVGMLYAGLMLTSDGPRLIEYNCRFGDPEAQVLLSLLDADLLDVMLACIEGRLDEIDLATTGATAATIVVAADGYPAAPRSDIAIPKVKLGRAQLFHAGTKIDDAGQLVSTGGRVLNVVGTGADLASALDVAYDVVDQLTGDDTGLFARNDIGWRHLPRDAYEAAGVSLGAGAATTARIASAVKSTHDDRVVAGLGSFGGVFDVSAFAGLDQPLLVATTDGVGTKTVLAEQLDRWEGCGADIVNHGINDVLVQGAKPLFFLDTVASATLDPEIVGRVVDGMAEACRNSGCVLLGGETAEMPDVLTAGAVDIAGTLVGVVERSKLLPRAGIAPGHLLVGLASSGLHTNGYSLARKVVGELDLNSPLPGGTGESIGEALLAVHRSYLAPLGRALEQDLIDGLAHITGGGLIDNLPRILPDGCGAEIDPTSWDMPPLFKFLVARAGLSQFDAFNILNCGIGMVAVVAPDCVDAVREAIAEETWVIGTVTQGEGVRIAGGAKADAL